MELLLLSQFNLDSKLPTFFELYLQGTLSQSLGDVFRFLHAVLAESWEPAATALPYSGGIFASLWALVEYSYLRRFDSTFAEAFYDLRRVGAARKPARGAGVTPGELGEWRGGRGVAPAAQEGVAAAEAGATPPGAPSATAATAANAANAATAATASAAPHTAAAAAGATATPAPAAAAAGAGVPAGTGEAPTLADEHDLVELSAGQRRWSLLAATLLPYLRARLQRHYKQLTDPSPDAQEARTAAERARPALRHFNAAVVRVFPLVHFAIEASSLTLAIGYMFGRTVFFSPANYAAGIALRRLDQKDYAVLQQNAGSMRAMRLGAMLIAAAVTGMRFLQWWGTTAGAATRNSISAAGSAAASLPMPPPPGPTPVADPAATPIVAGQCPVCRQTVSNAAVNVVSGYVFCYPCLQRYVELHGKCPVSHVRTSLQDIRRLYEA